MSVHGEMSMLNSKTEFKPEVVIIGSGNVATHIALRLDGYADIRQIYSRTYSNAKTLASLLTYCEPECLDDLSGLYTNADIYIVAVKDDVIPEIGKKLPKLEKGIAVHTSGSAPDDALGVNGNRCGVLYPLQTFSKQKNVDWSQITVFTYSSDADALALINKVANMLSDKVKVIDGNLRSRLHIAAVFACNFANYMWIKSERILNECGCTLNDFSPLLQETLEKALEQGAEKSQTGPARRGDRKIIDKHTGMLHDKDDAELYLSLSNWIMRHFGLI